MQSRSLTNWKGNENGETLTHRICGIDAKEGSDKKARWLEIGAAWPNDDGKGFNIVLDAQPFNGRITLRVNEPKAKTE